MSVETEKKYLNVNFGVLREKLANLNAHPEGEHFETNLVFDLPSRALVTAGKLLRLRTNEWPAKTENILTYKGPAKDCASFKSREEIECAIADMDAMKAILLSLGFEEIACYEKIRESFLFSSVRVELDTLPFTQVVEMEGDPGQCMRLAALLQLDKRAFSTKSYHELHQQWRAQNGLEPAASFVFSTVIRDRERRRIGLA